MASSIILHQDKICQGVLLSCLVQPQQEALLMTAIRMQLPPRAGSLACRRVLGVLHVAGGVAVIEGVTEGCRYEGVNCRGIAVALSFRPCVFLGPLENNMH